MKYLQIAVRVAIFVLSGALFVYFVVKTLWGF